MQIFIVSCFVSFPFYQHEAQDFAVYVNKKKGERSKRNLLVCGHSNEPKKKRGV